MSSEKYFRINQESTNYSYYSECEKKCNNCVDYYTPSGVKVYKCSTEDSSFLLIFILSIILIVLFFLIIFLILMIKRKRKEFVLNTENNEPSNLKNSARNLNVINYILI